MKEKASEVYFADLSGDIKSGLMDRLTGLLSRVGPGKEDLDRRLVAVKMHFGEKGNNAYVRPVYVSHIVDYLKEKGAKPYLTDTNTLYAGSRGDSVSHYWTAVRHGFEPAVVGAPVIIGGGLRGTEGRPVPVYGKHFEEVEIAAEILEADIIVGVAHFKGHEVSGFGGTLKNFGMGAASRKGKLAMHSKVSPYVKEEMCTGCRLCLRWCAHDAIIYEGGVASVDPDRCVGCGACLATCPVKAIRIVWNEQTRDMQQKMVEYAWGALKGHMPGRAFFLNFIMQVSPLCDCMPFSGSPIVPDIGVLASRDPVAIDQASVDLVNQARGLENSDLPEEGVSPGADKFKAIHPEVDWSVQLSHAEKLGMGSRKYNLVKL